MSGEASVHVALHVTHGPEEVAVLRAQIVLLLGLVQDAYHEGLADCPCDWWTHDRAEAAWAASATAETVREWQEEE